MLKDGFLKIPMSAVALFGEMRVRRVWNDREQKWYFSIVDGVAVLTDSVAPQNDINVMRRL